MSRLLTMTMMLSFLGGVHYANCDKPTSLSVMSFNLRRGTAPDGKNAWKHRKNIVVECITHYSPDLIGTQEALDFQIDHIAASLPEYAWYGIGRNRDGSDEHMAVFYKKKTLTPLEQGHFWLSKTPDVPGSKSWGAFWSRMVTWVKFQHRKNGRIFLIYNTHFSAISKKARTNSAALLLSRIPEDTSHPIIITGDFNARAETSECWKLFRENGFSDARLAAMKTVAPAATMSGFKPPEKKSDKRIDWVLLRGPLQVHLCETVLYNENGRYPSDHYPLFVSLLFPD